VLSVKELRTLASRLSAKEFRRQLGPFVLVQRPPGKAGGDTKEMGLPSNVQNTTLAKPEAVTAGALGLLFQFDELLVASVPPLNGVDELSVGRQPDSDLMLEDPSVSKRHATLRWDAASARCTIEDLGSTNGTFLNASIRLKRETTLKNGDILSFGEVQYWFLLTDTLHEKLMGQQKRDHGV
jgi:FHA domain